MFLGSIWYGMPTIQLKFPTWQSLMVPSSGGMLWNCLITLEHFPSAEFPMGNWGYSPVLAWCVGCSSLSLFTYIVEYTLLWRRKQCSSISLYSRESYDNFHLPLTMEANEELELIKGSVQAPPDAEMDDTWEYIWGSNKYASIAYYNWIFKVYTAPRAFQCIWKSKCSLKHKYLHGCWWRIASTPVAVICSWEGIFKFLMRILVYHIKLVLLRTGSTVLHLPLQCEGVELLANTMARCWGPFGYHSSCKKSVVCNFLYRDNPSCLLKYMEST